MLGCVTGEMLGEVEKKIKERKEWSSVNDSNEDNMERR